jgi:hypothetical protein
MARNWGRTRIGLLILGLGLSGCYAATRTTVRMVEADQKLAAARNAGAPTRAVYAWTKAEEYLKKARDEWGRSEYESAERLLVKSVEWSAEAARLARAQGPAREIDGIPEQIAPKPPPQKPEQLAPKPPPQKEDP